MILSLGGAGDRLFPGVIHQLAYLPDINIDRALIDATAATDTLNSGFVFIYIVLQFMHKPLADPLNLSSSGIMSGAVQGK